MRKCRMTRAEFWTRTKGRMSEVRRTVLDNRYDVVRPLGSGGMGEVYLARDRVLGRDVALKVLRMQYAGDDEFAERFKREAMSAASLSHPNIVQVYDRGETEEKASYIAMEYVPGGTLKERISREGPLEATDAAALGAQVAEAIGAAHERGRVLSDYLQDGIRDGHRRLHVPRTGPWQARDPEERSLLPRGGPLRGAHWQTAVHRGQPHRRLHEARQRAAAASH